LFKESLSLHKNETILNECNACVQSKDNLSIIVFVDDAKLSKSGTSGIICASFSMILDLPPMIRNSFKNIITNFLINSKKVDINKFMEKNMQGFERVLKNGIMVASNEKLNIKLVGAIADAPAMAKLVNMNQYNGYYGCVHCLHPGERLENFAKTVFPYSKNIKPRLNSDYLYQVKRAHIINDTYMGVKGSCWLSKFIQIPENIILDYMHLSCIGVVKSLKFLWLDSKREDNWFISKLSFIKFFWLSYFILIIGKKEIDLVNVKLKNIRFPLEFPRAIRQLSEINDFKATEFRNFLFYLIVFVFQKILPDEYYEHFLLYVTAIRLLCQHQISMEDLMDANCLLNYFSFQFKRLYGIENMSYKLHAHIHLITQIFRYGRLNTISCFPFEGKSIEFILLKLKNKLETYN